jgi:hypothetical protein
MNVKFDELYNSGDNFVHVQKSGDENRYYSKKAFTYDDILTSMNLVVSPDGVLQYMNTKTNNTQDSVSDLATDSDFQSKKPIRNNVGPELKHSYIYNKYYKNYKDPVSQEEEVIHRPLTKEEYKQFIINEVIQRKKNKQRIAHLKPKQMAFTTTPNMLNHTPTYASTNNLNHLFKIRFQQ